MTSRTPGLLALVIRRRLAILLLRLAIAIRNLSMRVAGVPDVDALIENSEDIP